MGLEIPSTTCWGVVEFHGPGNPGPTIGRGHGRPRMQCGHRHCACANSTTLLGLPLCISIFTTSPLRMQKHSGAAHRGPVGSRLPGGCMGGPSAGGAVDGERLPRGLLGGGGPPVDPQGVLDWPMGVHGPGSQIQCNRYLSFGAHGATSELTVQHSESLGVL